MQQDEQLEFSTMDQICFLSASNFDRPLSINQHNISMDNCNSTNAVARKQAYSKLFRQNLLEILRMKVIKLYCSTKLIDNYIMGYVTKSGVFYLISAHKLKEKVFFYCQKMNKNTL